MRHDPFRDVALVGAYNTRQAKTLEDHDNLSLIHDAVQGALASTGGLGVADIDGVNIATLDGAINARDGVHMLGGQPSWSGNAEMGIAAVLEAAAAIATGQCETVVIASGQAGMYVDRAATSPWTRPSHEFVECFGLYTAVEFALVAQRYMALYGTPVKALAEVAAVIRNNGARHPQAVFHGHDEVTPEDILASRMICEPFHLLDCAINSEGGAGLVLTTRARAADLDATPVYLPGGALDRQGMSYVTAPVWDKYGQVGRRAARIAFQQSGLEPADIDVCEFYDPFSFEPIRQFEAFGFCDEGEGGDFVMDGRIRIDGQYPLSTNGGLLSFSHAGVVQMLQKIVSGAQQLRGEYPEVLTVNGARTAMVSNGGAGALFCDVLLLALEDMA